MWFVPVTGTMCIVCHDLLKNEDEQKSHAVLPRHLENVKKFKTMVCLNNSCWVVKTIKEFTIIRSCLDAGIMEKHYFTT